MKYLIVIFLSFFICTVSAQVVGNKNIVDKFYALEKISGANIQMYAKVTIDMNAESGIHIKGESNLVDLISREVNNSTLTLDQKKWIEPTQDIEITIGAPDLLELEMGTHDKTFVKNISGNSFKVDAQIGDVILSGNIAKLSIDAQKGNVDASKLQCKSAKVIIEGDGRVIVNASENVECQKDEYGSFENVNKSISSDDCVDHNNRVLTHKENRFINIKIKNNSLKRNHFVVVGPKPDGRQFSYGFPMMPFQSKKERWTVGTKIYKENSIGIRTLLVTLSEDDENETVKLFD